MGYTVYITGLRKRQLSLLNKVFSDEWLSSQPLFTRWPGYSKNNLSYLARAHKEKTNLFGLDYGDCEKSHAIIACVAKALGRTKYWYDGIEMHDVNNALWWIVNPRLEWSKYQKMVYKFRGAHFRLIGKLIKQIEQRIKQFTDNEGRAN